MIFLNLRGEAADRQYHVAFVGRQPRWWSPGKEGAHVSCWGPARPLPCPAPCSAPLAPRSLAVRIYDGEYK